jgi:hypothetical protein
MLKSVTKTEVHRGSIGNKKGWAFSVYFGNRPYPNIISALYKTKKEAVSKLHAYFRTGKLDTYGSAEIPKRVKKKRSMG